MTHAVPMPETPTRVTLCACGFAVMPALSWAAWEYAVSEHLDQIPDIPTTRPGYAMEECKHHGLVEFRIKYRNGKRQRDCVRCRRGREQARRRRNQMAV